MPRKLGRYLAYSLAVTTVFTVVCVAFMSIVRLEENGSSRKKDESDSWQVQQAHYTAILQDDGIIKVAEDYDMTFDGVFYSMQRELPLSSGLVVDDVQVREGSRALLPGGVPRIDDRDVPGSFGVAKVSSDYYCKSKYCQRIVWHYQPQRRKQFGLDYRLYNLPQRYPQGTVLDLNLWGRSWASGVKQFEAQVILPQRLPPGSRLSVTPSWMEITPQRQIDGEREIITIDPGKQGLPRWQGLELRIMAPGSSWLGAASSLRRSDDRSGWAARNKEINKAKADESLRQFALILSFCLLLGFAINALWLPLMAYRRRDPPAPPESVVTEPLPGQSLAQGWAEAEEKDQASDRAFAATVLDLIARGYYDSDNVPYGQQETRLAISVSPDRQPGPLTVAEQKTLEFVDLLLSRGPSPYPVRSLADRVWPQDKPQWKELMKAYNEEAWATKADRHDSAHWVYMLSFFFILLPAIVILPFVGVPSLISFGVIVPLMVMMIVGSLTIAAVWPEADFKRIHESAIERVTRWRDYRRFVTTFHQLDAVPSLSPLAFERAFAAAVLWGVEEKFAAAARVHSPDSQHSSFGLDDPLLLVYSLSGVGDTLEADD